MDINNSIPMGPDDPDSHYEECDFDDDGNLIWNGHEDDPADEPIGSCEECGINLYAEDDSYFCDQCLWRMECCQ